MNTETVRPGVSILVFAILMSSFLLVCTGVWKTTTYLVDFAFQKQVYTQKRYVTEGIMRWICTWAISRWQELEGMLGHRQEITYMLRDVPSIIEHLKEFHIKITIFNLGYSERNIAHRGTEYESKDFCIKIVCVKDTFTFFKGQCNITRRVVQSGDFEHTSFWVHDWHIGM